MYSKAKIMGHPIHPMLVAFPIAFYTTTFVCFFLYQFFTNDAFVFRLGYVANWAGVLSALVAAVPGIIDLATGIPKGTAAKKRGALHGTLNVVALVLFALSLVFLRGTWNLVPDVVTWPLLLSAIGLLSTMAAGYHGYALIGTHKVGVELSPQQERLEQDQDRLVDLKTRRPQPGTV